MGLALGAEADCTVPARPAKMTSTTAVGATVATGATMTYTCTAGYTGVGTGLSTCVVSTMSPPILVCSGAQAIMEVRECRAVAAIVAHTLTII
ncbi:hypothetical protein ScPMuIL_010134 [Solemya velum]